MKNIIPVFKKRGASVRFVYNCARPSRVTVVGSIVVYSPSRVA